MDGNQPTCVHLRKQTLLGYVKKRSLSGQGEVKLHSTLPPEGTDGMMYQITSKKNNTGSAKKRTTTASRTLKKKLRDAIRRLKKKYHKAERKAQNVAKNYHYRIAHLKIQYSDLL